MNTTEREKKEKVQTVPGCSCFPGVRKTSEGYEFALEVPRGMEASLLLYRQGEDTLEIPFPEESREGEILSVRVKGIREEIRYNFQIEGEVIQDPRSRYLCNTQGFGEKVSETLCCGWKTDRYVWKAEKREPRSLADTILYKLQVRSFTMHRSSGVRKKGTFQAVEQKIPYLQELGVTAVLLMPAYEYRERMRIKRRDHLYGYTEEKRKKEENPRINCWGYTGDACYYAPKSAFCATKNPVQEFKHMVDAFHQNGLECLMEFYFEEETSPSEALEILKYWKREYHIDGFHLMGRGICQEVFMKDAYLSGTKLFFHDVDGEAVLGGRKLTYKNVGEYNEGFLYCMRHMLKGDENMMGEFLFRIRRNPPYNGVINYMADQDGFTMGDMVAYEERHNEENGENNQDGLEYNCTWNCGAEGPTRKQNIRQLRFRQLKNAFAMLMFSQGTPMIFQGDEWGNSQRGNNNAWCQDNELGWVDWRGMKKNGKLLDFVKKAVSFRKQNPLLHMETEPKGTDYKALGYPDISYHGEQAWYLDRGSSQRYLGVMYCGDYAGQDRDFIFLACNFHWMPHEIALPGAAKEISWRKIMATDQEESREFEPEEKVLKEKTIEIPPRTIIILAGKQDEKACGSGNILRLLQGTSF